MVMLSPSLLRGSSLDGRAWDGDENVAADRALQPTPFDPWPTRPSPDPSLVMEGSADSPLSLEGRSQAEGDLEPLALPARGQGEGGNGDRIVTRDVAPAIPALCRGRHRRLRRPVALGLLPLPAQLARGPAGRRRVARSMARASRAARRPPCDPAPRDRRTGPAALPSPARLRTAGARELLARLTPSQRASHPAARAGPLSAGRRLEIAGRAGAGSAAMVRPVGLAGRAAIRRGGRMGLRPGGARRANRGHRLRPGAACRFGKGAAQAGLVPSRGPRASAGRARSADSFHPETWRTRS